MVARIITRVIQILILHSIYTLSLSSRVSSFTTYTATTTTSKMSSMLRLFDVSRSGSRSSAALLKKVSSNGRNHQTSTITRLMMSTQSGDDTKPPTALAKLHLEDGSTLVGRSFGCHESVSGEVRFRMYIFPLFIYWALEFS